MNVNIYLPDSLGKRVRRMKGLSVSLICRKALERAIRKIERDEAEQAEQEKKRKTA
jgi:post-segregation antitoxin (ccd killing protein)